MRENVTRTTQDDKTATTETIRTKTIGRAGVKMFYLYKNTSLESLKLSKHFQPCEPNTMHNKDISSLNSQNLLKFPPINAFFAFAWFIP